MRDLHRLESNNTRDVSYRLLSLASAEVSSIPREG